MNEQLKTMLEKIDVPEGGMEIDMAYADLDAIPPPQITNEEADIALTFEEKLNERFEKLFKDGYERHFRRYVEERIQEEVAELGIKLGKNIARLIGDHK